MSALLVLDDVTVRLGARVPLRGLSLQVDAGEFVAVVGPNGAGKSTLLRAVTGELGSTGTVTFDGRARDRWTRAALARRLAVMTQHPQLSFDFTVDEVVAMGRLPHRGAGAAADRAVVDAVMAELSLQAFAGRSYLALSGGERQRVQFARVVAQIWQTDAPALLLLDEPTSALDLAQQHSVLGLAHRLRARGTAVLAVLHDLNLASRYADRVLMLRDGVRQVLAPPTQAFTPERIADVFGVSVECMPSARDGRPLVVTSSTAPAREDSH
jgi:iron complex transport system ATP-binding protein